MTTNQMVKLFAKVLKDAKPIELDAKTEAMIKDVCEMIRKT